MENLSEPAPTTTANPSVETAIRRGGRLLCSLQRDDGHWPGDYGGPLFLMPGLLIACKVTNTPLTDYQRARMVEYLGNVQNADGGFGLHIESPSYVLGTALNYVAFRLLGVPADDPRVTRARTWLRDHGGAAGIPTWGKIWLAILGVYDWDGVMPLPPELWLLPRSLPLHPGRLWCHTRAIHLPVTYLYGRRWHGPVDELVLSLRRELFVEDPASIDWPSLRERVAQTDITMPHSTALRALNRVLAAYDRRSNAALRRRALDVVLDHIRHEDETTSYLDIGPVSKAMNMVVRFAEDPRGHGFERHVARIADYLWDGHDGMKMQGYNGSQFWDTAFAVRALVDAGLASEERTALERANDFIDKNQVKENIPDHARHWRDATKGAFPFSTAEQAWVVADCTAKGVLAALSLERYVSQPLSRDRLASAVDVMLADQNRDGGWSEYERARAGEWVELFNAAEVFGRIMVAYSYVETTSACVQGLAAFRTRHPGYRSADIARAIERGASYLRAAQRPDGSFYGAWGVCFTYGTWFGIEGLLAAGASPSSPEIQRAAAFLLGKQAADGGWGESYRACVEARWVAHPDGSQVVQTAWAMLGLMAAETRSRAALDRAARFLVGRQSSNGEWPREGITGVFNRSCMIHYENYRHVMPLWALGRYAALPAAR
ncbi:MAG: terpene cyclase/mutase family protein [Polyangiaceae bacterium]